MNDRLRIAAVALMFTAVVSGCSKKDTDENEDSSKAAGTAAPASAPADRTADEAAIKASDDQYFAGVKAKDASLIVGTYSADAISNPPNSPPLKGTEAIRKYNEDFLRLPQVGMTGGGTLTKFSDDGTMAYELGNYTTTWADAKGKAMKEEGKYVNVFQKVDGKWKVVADAFSSNAPPPK